MTWAIVWFCTTALVSNMPVMMLFLAMVGDVVIVFLIACTFRGWPDSSNKVIGEK